MKQARKVALINVHDYPKSLYSAHWHIVVLGDDKEGYTWIAEIISNRPVGWLYKGERTPDRPPVAEPRYPADRPVQHADYVKMSAEQQAAERAAQEARRVEIARIHSEQPQPVYLIEEMQGWADTRDEADTGAQEWVLSRMPRHTLNARTSGQAGYALAGGPGWMVIEALWRALERLLGGILLTLGYATTLRNTRLQAVRDAIDAGAGAGLLRVYDGSRPATCGSATTKLAELTFTDPSAGAAAAGVITFSAIASDVSADAVGTATWFRSVDSTGTCCVDGSVGTAASDLNLNSTSISTGQQVAVTSMVITGGNP